MRLATTRSEGPAKLVGIFVGVVGVVGVVVIAVGALVDVGVVVAVVGKATFERAGSWGDVTPQSFDPGAPPRQHTPNRPVAVQMVPVMAQRRPNCHGLSTLAR
jgi:hypothetical protein